MNAMQTAVNSVVSLLVEGSYDVLEAMTHGRRLSARELRHAVEDYGRTLVPLPAGVLDELDVAQVKGAEMPTFHIVVDLWTHEEGRSDLSLELMLTDRYGGAFSTEILNLDSL